MKILLCTDGSEFSRAALEFCPKVIVDPKHTSLKILLTVERPAPMVAEPFAVSTEYYNGIEKSLRDEGNRLVEEAKTRVRALFPEGLLELTTEVITGLPKRVIVETAAEWQADLIVIGSHGYGFWNRAVNGSVSNAVLHQAPCAVLVVPKAV